MKIRVTLVNGATVDFDASSDFNFVSWMMSVRETGRWLMENIYIPEDQIAMVIRLDAKGKPEAPRVGGTIQ